MKYQSTRSKDTPILSSQAILQGIAPDGGLYVPTEIPLLEKPLEDLISMDYRELAYTIMKNYLTDFKEAELKSCVEKAYDDKFDTPLIAPLVEKEGVYFLELYHGPTLAFKDMALSILPHLLKTSIAKQGITKEVVILTATSGDTGKAALEGFSNVEGTKIIVFFPRDGVSEIQKRQMITQEGDNILVIAIEGNFDDAQNGVKEIFNDQEFVNKLYEENYLFSSANSINIGRLVPQIVYYFHGYLQLVKGKKIEIGESINVVVPTGNFGNILAGYYAKNMGLPIDKLICASNENHVLYDFLTTGVYDKRRELKLTNSPSMDILISSNLERLLYEISGRNEGLIRDFMGSLQHEGRYEIPEAMKENLQDFYGGYALEDEVYASIRQVYDGSGYVMDTHTAVAYTVYQKYQQETDDTTPTIILSTASPFKFGRSVCSAMDIEVKEMDDFRVVEKLSTTAGLEIPGAVETLEHKSILHHTICQKSEMKSVVEKSLKV